MRHPPGHGWLRRAGPWVGVGTSPAALMTGGGLADGMSGATLVVTLAAGVTALTALAVAQGTLGRRLGMALAGVVAGALGVEGSRRVGALVMLAMMLGWFGVNVGVAGTATARLAGIPDVAGMTVFGLLTLALTWRGVGALSWTALAAGAATVVLAAWGLHLAARTDPLTLHSVHTGVHPVGVVAGASLVVGYGAAFALRTPDFTADLARPRHVLWCGMAGLAIPLTAFALAGAALQAASGTWNLADVLRTLGSPTAAYLFVAVGFVGSVMTNLYSGALALRGAVPLQHHRAMLAVLVVGLALAASGFSDRMLGYLTAMAILAPGLIVLCLLAWRHRHRPPPGWRVRGLGAWAASALAGGTLGALDTGYGPLAAVVVAWLLGQPQLGGRRSRNAASPSANSGDA